MELTSENFSTVKKLAEKNPRTTPFIIQMLNAGHTEFMIEQFMDYWENFLYGEWLDKYTFKYDGGIILSMQNINNIIDEFESEIFPEMFYEMQNNL
jgi:hypothetical protein